MARNDANECDNLILLNTLQSFKVNTSEKIYIKWNTYFQLKDIFAQFNYFESKT